MAAPSHPGSRRTAASSSCRPPCGRAPETGPTPEALSGRGRHATRPVIAMDANGNALVGWVRYNGAWFAAQVARRNAGEAWATPQNLSDRGGNAGGLDLAMNRRGDAVVTWVQGNLTAIGNLWSSFRPAGAERWSRAPVTSAWRALQARIALDEAGDATAVWAGSMTISASFKPVGQPWQQNYLLSSFDHATAHPAVTTQAPREATAVWVQAETADDRIQTVFYDVNTSKEEVDDEEEEEEEEEETTKRRPRRARPSAAPRRRTSSSGPPGTMCSSATAAATRSTVAADGMSSTAVSATTGSRADAGPTSCSAGPAQIGSSAVAGATSSAAAQAPTW